MRSCSVTFGNLRMQFAAVVLGGPRWDRTDDQTTIDIRSDRLSSGPEWQGARHVIVSRHTRVL